MTSPDTPGFMRLFIAIPVPPEVRQGISRMQDRLQRDAPPGAIRWTPADQFHLTVKFLGDIHAEKLPELERSVADVCAHSPALNLSARGIGFFPHARKPRVVWIGADEDEGKLSELHRQLDLALRWLLPEERIETFRGHITLGRFKPGHFEAAPKLIKIAEQFHERHFGNWRVDRIEIVRSQLTALRAEHETIANFELRQPSEAKRATNINY